MLSWLSDFLPTSERWRLAVLGDLCLPCDQKHILHIGLLVANLWRGLWIHLWCKQWPMNAVICFLTGCRLCWAHHWKGRVSQSFPNQWGINLTKGKNARQVRGAQSLFLLLLKRSRVLGPVNMYFLDTSSKVWKGTGYFLSFSIMGCLSFPIRKQKFLEVV